MPAFYLRLRDSLNYAKHLRLICSKDLVAKTGLISLSNNTKLLSLPLAALQKMVASLTALKIDPELHDPQEASGQQRERSQDADLIRRVYQRPHCLF